MSRAADKSIVDLFREIAINNRSGLLRLTSGRVIKAIFFEEGIPVHGISNQSNEQIDFVLLNRGLTTQTQLDQAKELAGQPNKLGQTLVKTGVLDKAQLEAVTADLARSIILSVFGWIKAESAFDERVRAVHDVKVRWSAADCILEGVRAAASQPRVAQMLAPEDATVSRPMTQSKLASSGNLTPAESYILSRVEGPMQASELGDLTGLGDEETQKALCALIAIGLLTTGADNYGSEEAAKEVAAAEIEDDIDRHIDFFSHADYYEILGVARQTGTSEIKAAYYKLAKKYHPDRYRQPEHADLRAKLDSLFSHISQAWDTLGDATRRLHYDDQLRKTGRLESTVGRPTPPPPRAKESAEPARKSPTAPLPPREDKPRAGSAAAQSQPEPPRTAPPISSPRQEAHHGVNGGHSDQSHGKPPEMPPDKPRTHTGPLPNPEHAKSGPLPSIGHVDAGNHEPAHAPVHAQAQVHAQVHAQAAAGSEDPDHKSSERTQATPAQTPTQTAEFYYQQARARIDQKDYYSAIQLLRESVRMDPAKPQYHFHLGMNLLKNPRTRREGEYHLAKSAQLDPFNAQIRVKIGAMYKEAGLPKKAEHFFREALAMDPNNRLAQRELQGGQGKGKDDASIWKSDLGTIAKRILKK